jgi:hypothetical protein
LARPRQLRYFLPAGLSRFEETRMADKRTTPDPADRGHRKRPAPTIDLTATEVPAASAADGPSAPAGEQVELPDEPHPAQGQPDTAHEPESADNGDGSFRKRGLSAAILQSLLAGFAGAVIVQALFVGFYVMIANGLQLRIPVA